MYRCNSTCCLREVHHVEVLQVLGSQRALDGFAVLQVTDGGQSRGVVLSNLPVACLVPNVREREAGHQVLASALAIVGLELVDTSDGGGVGICTQRRMMSQRPV